MEGSSLTTRCDDIVTCTVIPGNKLTSLCQSDGSWIPNPLENECSMSTSGRNDIQSERISVIP